MIKELQNKIGQLQYEISLLGHSEEDLTGVTIRTDELKDLVKNIEVIPCYKSDSEQLCANCRCKPTQKLGFCNDCFNSIYSRA